MKQNLGAAIDKLHTLREEKRLLEERVKDIRKVMEEEEINIFAMLEEQDIPGAKGHTASVSITESIVPVIENDELFFEHILQTGDLHLLERRPSVRAYREIKQSGEEVPGLRPFTRRTLSLRKN
jgi:hypothetical protein